MSYEIISAETMDGLVAKVNERLAAGWRPQGGLILEHGVFYQAMVK
jgi:hypothetical protein